MDDNHLTVCSSSARTRAGERTLCNVYESLRRAAFTALALSASAWVLGVAVGRELVEVPVVRAAPAVEHVQTVLAP